MVHVVNRGIDRRAIFRAEGNYEHSLELLAKAVARFVVRVHGYVLMGNHYHLQLETPRANLSKAMQWLNAAYSIWYNRKYGRVGPLFQGRFKAILHDRRTHGLVINRYMHLNPVRVKGLGGHEGRGEVNKELEANGMQKLLKGDWREQHAVRQSAKGALSWEAITAAVSIFNPQRGCNSDKEHWWKFHHVPCEHLQPRCAGAILDGHSARTALRGPSARAWGFCESTFLGKCKDNE
jgi:REP element-mobilizing transposase RayT